MPLLFLLAFLQSVTNHDLVYFLVGILGDVLDVDSQDQEQNHGERGDYGEGPGVAADVRHV